MVFSLTPTLYVYVLEETFSPCTSLSLCSRERTFLLIIRGEGRRESPDDDFVDVDDIVDDGRM